MKEQIEALESKIAEYKDTKDRFYLFLVSHWQRELSKLKKKYEDNISKNI